MILLTAFGDDSSPGEAAEAGSDGYLHKPATASTLLDAIVGAFGMDAAPRLATVDSGQTLQSLDGLQLLVAEDNDINQQIARVLLEQLGAQVSIADNGRQALEMVQQNPPHHFDAVLMDLQMPQMDGLEATRRIRADQRYATLPIIAMTAHTLADQRALCLEAGMNDHVAKPIVPERLVEAILHQVRTNNPDLRIMAPLAPDPANPTGLPELPGLNIGAALRRVGNQPAEYLSLLRHFVKSQADCPAQIDDALASGRREDAERFAHTLRGTAANLGASALQAAAAAMETALRKHESVDAARRRLHTEHQALLELLRTALDNAPETSEPGAGLSGHALDQAVARLKHLMESADGKAPAFFRTIRADLAVRFGKEKIAELSNALQHYDYDLALTCLREESTTG